MKLVAASFVALSIISSFLFFVIILILLLFRSINLPLAIGLTILVNVILWLVGPWLTDLINRWFYKTRFLTREEVEQTYPAVAEIVAKVSQEHHFPFPKIGIIDDNNPTAFSYGSGRFNSRIVLTQGVFTFLNNQEIQAVVAHELGHIVNRDFIVMMIASTIVQVLYEIYVVLIRAKGRKSGNAKLIAVIAYVLYYVASYVLLYLSRTREYMADEFSAKTTNPQDLATGLIKIAYGIVTVEDDERTKHLLHSTRHLGIVDVKNIKHIGVASYVSHNDPNVLAEVMVFDRISPWATLVELNSTHPLTGKRMDRLSDLSKIYGKPFGFDIDAAIARMHIDFGRLWNSFFVGLLVYSAPLVFLFLSLLLFPGPFWLAGFAVGLLVQVWYRFPQGQSTDSTIIDEMRNPYASPLRGKSVRLNGSVIGRGVPGFVFSEDMMYQDKTGLTFLDYNAFFGFIGNFFFAIGKIKSLFGVPSVIEGWFFRGMGSMVSLKYLKTDKEVIRSHPILWSVIPSLILIAFFGFLLVR